MENKTPYIDLCCGIGGFRVGINRYSDKFECVLSADIKKDAVTTYNANFQENMPPTDLTTLENVPPFELLCCGFPCQPFSSAGTKNGFNDRRGGIIFSIRDLCLQYKPKYFILENVSNLMSLRDRETKRLCIDIIREMFEELGYHVSAKELNSKQFGVPQSRKRVFIVGSLNHGIDLDNITEKPPRYLRDIIEFDQKYTDIDETFTEKLRNRSLKQNVLGCRMNDKRGGSSNIHSWELNGDLSEEQIKLMNLLFKERRKKHWAEKKGIVWTDGMPLTLDEMSTFYHHADLQSLVDDIVAKGYLKFEYCKDLVGNKRKFQEDKPKGYNLSKGKLSHKISTILHPDSICPTLTATDASKLVVFLDGQHLRRLTATELKRICGFPDNYIVPDGVNKFDLFGNMCPPPFITAIMSCIEESKQLLNTEKRREKMN